MTGLMASLNLLEFLLMTAVGAAESISGADFALTAVVKDIGVSIAKAVLGQARSGDVDRLNASERTRLNGQVREMRERTRHYVVVETPIDQSGTVAVRRSKPSDPSFETLRKLLLTTSNS